MTPLNNTFRFFSFFFGLSLSNVLAQPTEEPTKPPFEAELESTSGSKRLLSSYRGKVLVLFYEDRDSTSVNDELKGTLSQMASDTKLADKVVVVPVANLQAYNFHPASDIARSVVRSVAKKYNAEILMDWSGLLSRSPLNFSKEGAHVAVIDTTGSVTFRHTGLVTDEVRKKFFSSVKRLLKTNS